MHINVISASPIANKVNLQPFIFQMNIIFRFSIRLILIVMVAQLVERRRLTLKVLGSSPGQTSLQAPMSCRVVHHGSDV